MQAIKKTEVIEQVPLSQATTLTTGTVASGLVQNPEFNREFEDFSPTTKTKRGLGSKLKDLFTGGKHHKDSDAARHAY